MEKQLSQLSYEDARTSALDSAEFSPLSQKPRRTINTHSTACSAILMSVDMADMDWEDDESFGCHKEAHGGGLVDPILPPATKGDLEANEPPQEQRG